MSIFFIIIVQFRYSSISSIETSIIIKHIDLGLGFPFEYTFDILYKVGICLTE